MLYRKIKRTCNNNYLNCTPEFIRTFPELKHLDDEELANRFMELKLDFYTEEVKPIPKLIRLTLPFAVVLWLLMFIFAPLLFIITGKWGYSLGKKNIIYNWFTQLKLM